MTYHISLITCLLMFLSASSSSIAEDPKEPAERNPKWAEPVKMNGVPNLHKVSDALFRSAQPTAEGMKNLEKKGIVKVVSLRSFNSDKDELKGTKLEYERITMKAWHPEWKEAVRFLKIVSDPKQQPVLVHCKHGSDRTGTMCALYRIVIQGWSKEDAIKEMTDGGYGFHEVFGNLPKWIKGLDVEKLKKEAGIEEKK